MFSKWLLWIGVIVGLAGGASAQVINQVDLTKQVKGILPPPNMKAMGASGTGHSAGIVPDPGSTAGATRYLNEQGAWLVPNAGAAAAGGADTQVQINCATTLCGDLYFIINHSTHAVSAYEMNGVFNSDAAATSGSPATGISNTVTVNCGTGCMFTVPANSPDTNPNILTLGLGLPRFHAQDLRAGTILNLFNNPNLGYNNGTNDAMETHCRWDTDPTIANSSQRCHPTYITVAVGGISVDNTWTDSNDQLTNAQYWTRGQAFVHNDSLEAYKIGDSILSDRAMYYRGGCTGGSDECAKLQADHFYEAAPPSGTVAVFTAPYTLKANFTSNPGNQEDGGDVLDVATQVDSTFVTGQTYGTGSAPNTLTTSTSHTISSAIGTLASQCGANVASDAPVQTACTITTISGTFVKGSNTVTCIADTQRPENVFTYAAGGTGNVTLALRYVHPAGTYVYQGTGCGDFGDTPGGVADPTTNPTGMQTYRIVGAPTTTTYAFIVEYKEQQQGNNLIPMPSYPTVGLGTLTRSGNVVTSSGSYDPVYNAPDLPSGVSMQVTGATPSDFNGTVTNTTSNKNGITYTLAGSSTSGSGGSLTAIGANNLVLYCGAEVTRIGGIYYDSQGNPKTDGTMSIEASKCPWTVGHAIIQPNLYNNTAIVYETTVGGTTPPINNVNEFYDDVMTGLAYAGAAFHTLEGDGATYSHDMFHVYDAIHYGFAMTYAPVSGNPQNPGILFDIGCPIEGCISTAYDYDLFRFHHYGSGPYSEIKFSPSLNQLSFPGLQVNFDALTIGGIAPPTQASVAANATAAATAQSTAVTAQTAAAAAQTTANTAVTNAATAQSAANAAQTTANTALAGVAPGVPPTPQTLTDATAIAWNEGGVMGATAVVNLNHSVPSRTLNVTGLAGGSSGTIVFKQDSTGGVGSVTLGTCNTGVWYVASPSGGYVVGTTLALTTTAGVASVAAIQFYTTNCYINIH